jgi:hypothetical protein
LPSSRPIRTSSQRAALPPLQHQQDVAFLDGLPFRDEEARHAAAARRFDRDLHLHGLEHQQLVAGLDGRSDLGLDPEHGPGHLRFDVRRHRPSPDTSSRDAGGVL